MTALPAEQPASACPAAAERAARGPLEVREPLVAPPDEAPSYRAPGRAALYALALLAAGAVLHPTLKLFYSAGPENGLAKNTLSVVDAAASAGAVLVLRGAHRWLWSGGRAPLSWQVAKSAFAPGLGVFGAISLATLANYESLWTFLMLAPLEIVFVVVLSCAWQKVTPTAAQVVASFLVLCGSALLTASALQRQSHHAGASPADGWVAAFLAATAFRLNQALTTIFIRNACVELRAQGLEDVLDISLCKLLWVCLLCVPYALVTEGLDAWALLFRARGAALVYLLLSAAVTCAFQVANVGLNSCLKSVPAAVVMQMQPLMQVFLALLLSGSSLRGKLRLEWDGSPLGLSGSFLLLAGAICCLASSQLRPRPRRVHA